MSLITQCPACATMFRVVPDQLRISEGWVRCGQCEEVFDANAHLQTLDEAAVQQPGTAPVPPVDEPAPPPLPSAWVPPQAPDPSDAYDWGPILQPPPLPSTVTSALLEQGAQANAPDTATYPEDGLHFDPLAPTPQETEQPPDPTLDAFLQGNPHDLLVSEEPAAVQVWAESADGGLQQAPAVSVPDAEPLAQDSTMEPEHARPSFMASASSSSAKGRWLGKGVLWTLCVLLTLALALQYLALQRDRVAATAPALRPALVTVCGWLACSISAPQQIEAIAIESSAFTSLKPGVYVLSVGLKNAATMDLATPALELTLTDLQDQAVLRRVLLPAEWAAKPQLAASAELSANIPIRVQSDAVVAKIAGYKLLAFYP